MTEKTARAEDAAAPPEASATDQTPAAQQQGDAAALAAEFKDRLLRTLAEMENLRKRTEREVTDARLYGVASFARLDPDGPPRWLVRVSCQAYNDEADIETLRLALTAALKA